MLPTEITKIAEETQKIEDELFGKKKEGEPKEEPKPEEKPKEGELPKEEPPKEEPPKEESPKEESPKEEPPQEPPKPEDFEHKFKVLKGKYDKEVPRVHQEAREARDRAIELEAEVVQLRTEIAALKTEPPKPKVEIKPITLDEIEKDPDITYIKENFPDVWKGLRKMFQKTLESTPIDQDLKTRVEKIEVDVKTVAETTARTSLQNFHKYLDDNIEGWRIVNKDPKFKEWLNEEDRYTGQPKITLIQEGIKDLDAPRVARFFEDFAKEHSASDTPIVDTEDKDKVGGEPTPKKEVVVPPKGKPPAPPKREDAAKEIITTEFITDFYDKLRRGHYIGRETEALAEEKRIEKAVVEGRVK